MLTVVGLSGSKGAGKDTAADLAVQSFKGTKLSFARPFKEIVMKNILGLTDEQCNDPAVKESKLTSDFVFTHRILRKIIHKVADEYNMLKHYNVINPYAIALNTWENTSFVGGPKPILKKEPRKVLNPETKQLEIRDVEIDQRNTYRDVLRYVSTDIIRALNPKWHIDMALSQVARAGLYVITDVRFINEVQELLSKYHNNFFLINVQNSKVEIANSDTHVSETERSAFKFDGVIENNGDKKALEKEVNKVFTKLLTRFDPVQAPVIKTSKTQKASSQEAQSAPPVAEVSA